MPSARLREHPDLLCQVFRWYVRIGLSLIEVVVTSFQDEQVARTGVVLGQKCLDLLAHALNRHAAPWLRVQFKCRLRAAIGKVRAAGKAGTGDRDVQERGEVFDPHGPIGEPSFEIRGRRWKILFPSTATRSLDPRDCRQR